MSQASADRAAHCEPASLKAIERAVKKAQSDHDRAVAAAKAQQDAVDRAEQPDEPEGEEPTRH